MKRNRQVNYRVKGVFVGKLGNTFRFSVCGRVLLIGGGRCQAGVGVSLFKNLIIKKGLILPQYVMIASEDLIGPKKSHKIIVLITNRLATFLKLYLVVLESFCGVFHLNINCGFVKIGLLLQASVCPGNRKCALENMKAHVVHGMVLETVHLIRSKSSAQSGIHSCEISRLGSPL